MSGIVGTERNGGTVDTCGMRAVHRMVRSLYPFALLLGAGCGVNGWHRVARMPAVAPDEQIQVWSASRQVQVWSGGRVERWKAVVFRRDSVTGIPYLLPTTCDACRHTLPRAQVDSIRMGSRELTPWEIVGLCVVVLPVVVILSDEHKPYQ